MTDTLVMNRREVEKARELEKVRAQYRRLTEFQEHVVKGIDLGDPHKIAEDIRAAQREMRALEAELEDVRSE